VPAFVTSAQNNAELAYLPRISTTGYHKGDRIGGRLPCDSLEPAAWISPVVHSGGLLDA
jgi:hypothetical protein